MIETSSFINNLYCIYKKQMETQIHLHFVYCIFYHFFFLVFSAGNSLGCCSYSWSSGKWHYKQEVLITYNKNQSVEHWFKWWICCKLCRGWKGKFQFICFWAIFDFMLNTTKIKKSIFLNFHEKYLIVNILYLKGIYLSTFFTSELFT